MAIFTTRLFDKKLKSEQLTDDNLCDIAREVMDGRFEADLGGGVIKKRIALSAGKRSARAWGHHGYHHGAHQRTCSIQRTQRTD